MKHWPADYPNEMTYIIKTFFQTHSNWQYPTYSHIVPLKNFWVDMAKSIYKDKEYIEFCRKIFTEPRAMDHSIPFLEKIEDFNLIAPLVEAGKLEEAGVLLFNKEKKAAKCLENEMPTLGYDITESGTPVILRLPRDLERSWKNAVIKAYHYALNESDIGEKSRELLIEKAGWLVE